MKNKISGMRNAYNFQKTATTCVLRENSNENKRLDQFAIELSVILLWPVACLNLLLDRRINKIQKVNWANYMTYE